MSSSRSIAKGTKHRYFQRIGYSTPAPSAAPSIIENYNSRPATVQTRRISTAKSQRVSEFDDDESNLHPNYIPADPYHDEEEIYEDPVIDPDPVAEDWHEHNAHDGHDGKHMCMHCVAKRLRRKKAEDNTCVSCAFDRWRIYKRNPNGAKPRSKSLPAQITQRPKAKALIVTGQEEPKKKKNKKKFKIKEAKRKMANNKEGPPIWHNVGDPTQRVYATKWQSDFVGDENY